eukprot:TRINITY_DN21705_c0_g1_i1.p1 TRINITY_DN21705_c0_g1~~TRINITY_DN21705_c0_g1_i1.p1  ORF type:complete len:498 (+),score=71.12 TRINITY_DN21705_c0_g1_i1:57-1496(+)
MGYHNEPQSSGYPKMRLSPSMNYTSIENGGNAATGGRTPPPMAAPVYKDMVYSAGAARTPVNGGHTRHYTTAENELAPLFNQAKVNMAAPSVQIPPPHPVTAGAVSQNGHVSPPPGLSPKLTPTPTPYQQQSFFKPVGHKYTDPDIANLRAVQPVWRAQRAPMVREWDPDRYSIPPPRQQKQGPNQTPSSGTNPNILTKLQSMSQNPSPDAPSPAGVQQQPTPVSIPSQAPSLPRTVTPSEFSVDSLDKDPVVPPTTVHNEEAVRPVKETVVVEGPAAEKIIELFALRGLNKEHLPIMRPWLGDHRLMDALSGMVRSMIPMTRYGLRTGPEERWFSIMSFLDNRKRKGPWLVWFDEGGKDMKDRCPLNDLVSFRAGQSCSTSPGFAPHMNGEWLNGPAPKKPTDTAVRQRPEGCMILGFRERSVEVHCNQAQDWRVFTTVMSAIVKVNEEAKRQSDALTAGQPDAYQPQQQHTAPRGRI